MKAELKEKLNLNLEKLNQLSKFEVKIKNNNIERLNKKMKNAPVTQDILFQNQILNSKNSDRKDLKVNVNVKVKNKDLSESEILNRPTNPTESHSKRQN